MVDVVSRQVGYGVQVKYGYRLSSEDGGEEVLRECMRRGSGWTEEGFNNNEYKGEAGSRVHRVDARLSVKQSRCESMRRESV